MDIVTENEIMMPVVALRGLVVFPGMFIHFDVGRSKSMAAVKEAMAGSREVFLVAQKDIGVEEPEQNDLYETGVIATVCQTLKISGKADGPVRVAVEGLRRARLTELMPGKRTLHGMVIPLEDRPTRGASREYEQALVRHTKELFEEYSNVVPQLPQDISVSVLRESDPGKLADYIAGNVMLEYQDRQRILENVQPVRRLEDVCVMLSKESQLLTLEADIQEKVQNQIDDNQKEYYLREQMRVISEELGGGADELDDYRMQIDMLSADDEVKEKLLRACTRLEKSAPQSPEAAVERNYLDVCLSLPWGIESRDNLNLSHARKVLDDDHYGLKEVKERILELLAVRKLAPDITGQIICLSGPPGVGKTSVARSIARAMGRQYVRISLGGVKDEAEIRGHRKTYIGSMPGRIMDAIQKAGVSNPLILLDEIDKLSADYKGDPTSALLEVLDPEQNSTFRDHYIELPFDLSHVLFITTANLRENIPAPLQDRMEMIELGSYTAEEKFHIARNHLVKKQIKRHGMTGHNLRITDDAIRAVIEGYTREAGVRKLEQNIAAICRKAAVKVAEGSGKITVKAADISEYLGHARYLREDLTGKNEIGVVNGLAWTQVGGEVLTVEAAVLEGSGKLELTGSLGDVMQESAKAAVSYIRSMADKLAIEKEFYKTKDIHIHVPEGATPKDGPSAGVTMATALLSALSGVAVKGDVAMTGEITLRGRVLPIGGLREKSMAAYLAGVKKILIPADNLGDLDEVADVVKENAAFIPVRTIEAVWAEAMENSAYLADSGKAEPEVPLADSRKNTSRAAIRQ